MPEFGTPQLIGLGTAITLITMAKLFLKGANASIGGGGGDKRGRMDDGGGAGKKAIKWIAFAMHLLAGGGFAIAFLAIARAAVEWGTGVAGSWLGITFTVVIVGIGWWAMDGLVALIKDISDGVPDNEAFRAALFMPTTIPLGFAALWTLFTNPQGAPTGMAALALSIIGGVFMHRILTKIAAVSTGKKIWHWATVVLCLIVGTMHGPAFIYINEWIGTWFAGAQLNVWIINIALLDGIRLAAVGAACCMAAYAVGDNLKGDKLPGWPTWWAAMYSIPVFGALGLIALSGFQTNAEAVFTAFSMGG